MKMAPIGSRGMLGIPRSWEKAAWCALCLAGLSPSFDCSAADPISVLDVVAWREVRGINSVGNAPGDFLKLGALQITPNPYNGNNGSVGTSVRATPPDSSTSFLLSFVNSPASPNEFSRSNFTFTEARAAPWTVVVTNPESTNSPVTVMTPPVRRVDGTIPGTQQFVQDMSVSGTGTDVTFRFASPPESQHDTIGVRIWDRKRLTPTGFPTLIHAGGFGLAPDATSYTPPHILNAEGDTLQLGGQYTVSIQLQETRKIPGLHPLLSRSVSYFNFSPLGPSAPVRAFLPMVGPDNVYHFAVGVQAGQTIFIDPEFAIGYEYRTGAGDPNFASVVLPNAGDGLFYLETFTGSVWEYRGIVSAGVPYDFGGSGVARFRVSGIEPSAGLDPKDPTAFVSGLTFVSDGKFTGTMTPLTTFPDNTHPVITSTISGALGGDGWYIGPVTVAWNVADGESGITSPPCPTTTLSTDTPGTTLECTAASGGGSTSKSVTLKVDRTAPTLTCEATPGVLWAPNDKMVDIAVTVSNSDALSGPAAFTLTSLTSNEPDSGQGSGDVEGWVLGTADLAGRLRASRSGTGSGRVYTLEYRGTDVAGNAATCVTSVTVPHDERK